MATEWIKRWGRSVSRKPVRPGIWRLETGGWLVRGRVTDRNGHRHEVMRVVHEGPIQRAQAALDDAIRDKRDEVNGAKPQRQLFSEFAASRFEAKCLDGSIKSAKGREKWEGILRVHVLPVFGEMRCDEIRVWDVTQWRSKLARMVAHGYTASRKLRNGKTLSWTLLLHPETANTWIALFRGLCREMVALLELERDPSAALKPFDTSQRPTYSDEFPNALTAQQAGAFLGACQRLYPQHVAMTLLGFVTGKRPSTLRPLRARGPEADIDWSGGSVSFRRSNTRGDEFMVGTKTGTSEKVFLPPEVLATLAAHRETLNAPPLSPSGKPPLWWREAMATSPLLFPGRDGGPRSPSVLDKVFADLSKEIGLPFVLTPRGMRRTCNDLQRAAGVAAVVTRQITGHLTEEMQIKYSTAEALEQRTAIAKVIDLVGYRRQA